MQPARVLEIASGTGQHAEYFAGHLPHITWQSTDLAANIDSLNRRISHADLKNLLPAFALNVSDQQWPCEQPFHVFTANSLHIMSAASVKLFFDGARKCLGPGALLMVYGPFKYHGEFTTQSNAKFDLWLKARDPLSGIRDFETVQGYAVEAGLVLLEDNAMPANNQLLVWQKEPVS